ncbi:lytic murein transglycosylase [Beijerinckia indica]|uniref:Lytic murein transglycosylase n=1 Tax=Beijerinckia indica subsp. indica (strain ATCC 9039 / DSM 1715 / NCIMB 8712) TaxID=395963 RepID=B2IDZ1_BEII9|nr:lytic murein transglycosylase [Beijerinckia indica subsp. indica ATCC 9039]
MESRPGFPLSGAVPSTISGVALAASLMLGLSPAHAATCRDPRGFEAFLDDMKHEASAQGISSSTIASALDNVSYDPSIVSKDHGQHVFRQSFEQFSGRMVSSYRLHKGAALIKQYAGVFNRIEQQFGVPAPIIVAIWGLETDFGAVNGNTPTFRALATLAFDCRRSPMFQSELIDALRVVQRGDLPPSAMRGAWAGEIGQTQFMPSSYYKFAVDFSGNGRRDLIHDVPDVLASTANFLSSYGWKRGAGWAPGQPNFPVIKEWNKADVYSRTIAYFATRLNGGD